MLPFVVAALLFVSSSAESNGDATAALLRAEYAQLEWIASPPLEIVAGGHQTSIAIRALAVDLQTTWHLTAMLIERGRPERIIARASWATTFSTNGDVFQLHSPRHVAARHAEYCLAVLAARTQSAESTWIGSQPGALLHCGVVICDTCTRARYFAEPKKPTCLVPQNTRHVLLSFPFPMLGQTNLGVGRVVALTLSPPPVDWSVALSFMLESPCAGPGKCALLHRLTDNVLHSPNVFVMPRTSQVQAQVTFDDVAHALTMPAPPAGKVTNNWRHVRVSVADRKFTLCETILPHLPRCITHTFEMRPRFNLDLARTWILGGSSQFHAPLGFLGHVVFFAGLDLSALPMASAHALALDGFPHHLAADLVRGCSQLHRKATDLPSTRWPPPPFAAFASCAKPQSATAPPSMSSPASRYGGPPQLKSPSGMCVRVVRESERVLLARRGFALLTSASPQQARKILTRAACLDDPTSNVLVAVVYGSDTFIQKQPMAFLLRAVILGNSLALQTLAFRLKNGIDVPVDVEAAFALFSHAGGQTLVDLTKLRGTGHTTRNVALEHTTDVDVGHDSHKMQWLRALASAGNAAAQLDLGLAYYEGNHGLEPNFQLAVRHFQQAAAQQNADALYMMGIVHRRGHGVPQNATAMKEYFEKAARLNHVGAMNGLGAYWQDVKKNSTHASLYFFNASQLGSGDGCFNFANFLAKNVSKNVTQVAQFYLKGAKTGHAHAELAVSKILFSGSAGLPINRSRALGYAVKVAQRGFALGNLVHDSVHAFVADNVTKAAVLQLLLAEAGLLSAQQNLAWLASTDVAAHRNVTTRLGGPRAVLRAWELAAFSSPAAQCQLAHCHWYGLPGALAPNETRAVEIYAAAGARGDPEALFNLGVIAEFGLASQEQETWEVRSKKALAFYQKCARQWPCALAMWKLQIYEALNWVKKTFW